MSNLNELKRFESDLKNSEELQKKLDEAVKRIVDAGQVQNDGEVMVLAAKELGYDISIAALEQAKAEAEEIDVAELEQISGGGNANDEWCLTNYQCQWAYEEDEDKEGHGLWCVTAWHCSAISMHTEGGSKREMCWVDYLCLVTSHTHNPGR